MHVGGGWVGFSISKFARHMRVLVELGKIFTGFFSSFKLRMIVLNGRFSTSIHKQ